MYNKKQSFIHGAVILLAAGIINRILGFVPRIALPRLIGAEGVGLYQMGYPLMIALITLVTGGIPIAVAKLVAEAEAHQDADKVRSILRTAFTLIFLASVPLTIALLFASSWISTRLLTDERVYYTMLAMSPILIIVSLSSVIRGYFQGKSNMIPTALSQVAETVARSICVLGFALLMLPYGVEFAAAGAMAGVLCGEIAGIAVLMFQFYSDRRENNYNRSSRRSSPSARPRSWRPLLAVALPVTGSRLVGSVSYFLESIMIVQSLAVAGIATALATAQYGMLQGMVIPILLLPGVLTYSLSVSLVPSLSEASARNDMRTIHKRLHQSLRLALITGAPFAVILFVLAEPICMMLYGDPAPAAMLRWMAPFALFLYVQNPLQATLQALDKPGAALINTFIGAALKLVLIVLLAAKLAWGIFGAVIAICVNMALVTILHGYSIRKLTGFALHPVHMFKTALAMMVMGLVCYGIMHELQPDRFMSILQLKWVRFMAAAAGSTAVYIGAIFACGLVHKRDLFKIPWLGPRLQHGRWPRRR